MRNILYQLHFVATTATIYDFNQAASQLFAVAVYFIEESLVIKLRFKRMNNLFLFIIHLKTALIDVPRRRMSSLNLL